MAKGVKIGKVTRKPGTLVYVDKAGNVMETSPARGRKKSSTVKKKTVAKKAATKKKSSPKRKTVAKKKTK